MTKRVSKTNRRHRGYQFVRALWDSFDLERPDGRHVCMVFDTFKEPLWILKKRFVGGVLPDDVLKLVVHMVLQGLRYWHTECHVIHTDETIAPLPQKQLDIDGKQRAIYLPRNAFGSTQEIGTPVITDFGLAVRGDEQKYRYYPIQPDIYSAPEVVPKAGWSYSADIWNLGVLMWNLLQGSTPFQAIQPGGVSFSYEHHLANIIALLGPPPRNLIEQGRESLRFFDDDGKFKYPELVPKDAKMEQLLDCIEGDGRSAFF